MPKQGKQRSTMSRRRIEEFVRWTEQEVKSREERETWFAVLKTHCFRNADPETREWLAHVASIFRNLQRKKTAT